MKYYTSSSSQVQIEKTPRTLEIVLIRVVRFGRRRIRRNNALDATALHPHTVLICGTRRDLFSCTPSMGTVRAWACARGLRFLLFALLDDLSFTMFGGGGGNKIGGVD